MACEPTFPALSARSLSRRFGKRPAVHEISLELQRGEVLGLLGPNGAGKSTTLQMLTGNLAPDTGSVTIGGLDLAASPREAKALLGYLPDTPPLYPDFTVDEFLALAARLHRVAKAALPGQIQKARARCGLADVAGKRIGSLSKGYQQRVGIAQAIVHEPPVVILDEPTVGLDPLQVREIRGLIRELRGKHSVILSTHILHEAESICDRVLILHRGREVHAGSIESLERVLGGHVLELELRAPPAQEALLQIPGVERVQPAGGGRLRIHYAPGNNPTEALLKAAVEGGWGVERLAPLHTSLEEVFVQLTSGDDRPSPQGIP